MKGFWFGIIAIAVTAFAWAMPSLAWMPHGIAGRYVNADGWTVVQPVIPTSPSGSCSAGTYNGTCYVYLDNTGGQGNDSTCARQAPPFTATPTAGTQCATAAKAASLMRNGSSDWLLVKAGTTYSSATPATVTAGFGQINFSGSSCLYPAVISTYGTGARPLFNIANNDVAVAGLKSPVSGTAGSNLFIEGLEFYGFQRDSTQPGNFVTSTAQTDIIGLNFFSQVTCTTVENMKFSYLGEPVLFQVAAAGTNATLEAQSLIMRRNVVTNAWLSGAPNGVFTQNMNQASYVENILDTLGWDQTLSAVTTVSYTSGANAVFTWPSTPFFKNNNAIRCLTTQDGITANTNLFVINLSGSTFNLSLTSGGAAITTSGAGSINCNWFQTGYNIFSHSLYIHDNYPFVIQSQDTAYGNITTNDSSGWQFRNGGPINNNFYALGGYGTYLFLPIAGASFITQNNVVTSMMAGGPNPSGNGGHTGVGLITFANYPYSLGITGTATNNDVITLTFTCSPCGTGVIPALPGNPVSVQYTVTTGQSPTQIAAGLAAAITANSNLASYGITAANDSAYNCGCVINIYNFGPPTGNMVLTYSVSGAQTEILYQASGNLNVGSLTLSNNLVFNYDTVNSTQAPGAGLWLEDWTQGATVSNNVVCNWGATPYTDASIATISGSTSSASGGAKTRITVSRAYFLSDTGGTTGQGPVTISGLTGASAYLNGNTWGVFVNGSTIDVSVAFQSASITGSGTIKTNPYSANTLSGNRFGTGGSSACSTISNPPASNASGVTLGAYLQSIGLGPSCTTPNACVDQDFINFQKLQSKQNWNPDLRACKVNDWMRVQFNMTQVGCPNYGQSTSQ